MIRKLKEPKCEPKNKFVAYNNLDEEVLLKDLKNL